MDPVELDVDSSTVGRDAKFICDNAEHVVVAPVGVETAAKLIYKAISSGKLSESDWSQQSIIHRKFADEQYTIDWIFLVSSLNFSFWCADGETKQHVTYKGVAYTGYYSLCAAVNRALDDGVNMTDPAFYSTISLDHLRRILVSDSGMPLPLIEQRLEVLHEVGSILMKRFNGSFYTCYKTCGRSSQKLLSLVVNTFPCYRDSASYKGRQVWFLKRAQILLSDIHSSIPGGAFDDVDRLTAFADYRVPQVLHHLGGYPYHYTTEKATNLGALRYSDELMDRLEKCDTFANGEQMEVEIRAAIIHACILIVDKVNCFLDSQGDIDNAAKVNSAQVDYFLWCYRRANNAAVQATSPMHRCRCIFY